MLLSKAAKPAWHLAGAIFLAVFALEKPVRAQTGLPPAFGGGESIGMIEAGIRVQSEAYWSNGNAMNTDIAGISGREGSVGALASVRGSNFKIYENGDGSVLGVINTVPDAAWYMFDLDLRPRRDGLNLQVAHDESMLVSPPPDTGQSDWRDRKNIPDFDPAAINLGGGPIEYQAPAVTGSITVAVTSFCVQGSIGCDGSSGTSEPNEGQQQELALWIKDCSTDGTAQMFCSKIAESIAASPDCSTSAYAQDLCFMPVVGLAVLSGTYDHIEVVCSGVIVADGIVLTAAHCLCEEPEYVIFGTRGQGKINQYAVVDGTPGTLVGSDSDYQNAALFEIARSEALNNAALEDDCDAVAVAGGGGFHNNIDIALIEIKQTGAFSKAQFRAVIIGAPPVGSIVNIAGFGPNPSTRDKELSPGVRQVASSNLTGSGNRGDAGWMESDPLSESDDALFMQDGNSQSELQQTCRGDSGGGAFLRLESGRLAVFAILSGGQENCKVAGRGVFTPLGHPDVRRFLRERGIDLGETGWPQVFAKMECEGQGC